MEGACAWNDSKKLKLIELFENYDCLYNVQSKDYHNRTRKNAAIHEIAIVLDIHTVSDVISSYQLFSAILWGKLCEMFVILTLVDVNFSIR